MLTVESGELGPQVVLETGQKSMSSSEVLKRITPGRVLDALSRMEKDEIAENSDLLSTLSPKTLENQELAMLNLVAQNTSTGFGGRTVLELGPDSALVSQNWVWNPCFKVGDIVKVEEQPKKNDLRAKKKSSTETESSSGGQESSRIAKAVVFKVGRESISVVAEDDSLDMLPQGRLWLTKLSDTAVFKRMNWAIEKMKKEEGLGLVAQLMQGRAQAQVGFDKDAAQTCLSSQVLNETQQSAIGHAIGSNISVIHGPPGTGKTSTIVEIVCQLVARGERVLVCGPSNVSVDNIVERLAGILPMSNGNHELLRLGHPARLSPAVLRHSYDLLSKSGDDAQLLRELQAEIQATLSSALGRGGASKSKSRGSSSASKSSRGEAFKLLKELRKDYRSREGRLMETMLKSAKVVAATLHGAGSKELGSVTPMFSTIIIDEVSQALLPQCWIPAVIDPEATRIIVAGDNKQLPPTIKSRSAAALGVLETTLFDAILAAHGDAVRHMISIQYRMCQEIMEFPSKYMYDGQLVAHESVGGQRLSDLPGVEANSLTESPVLWIDTMNGVYPEVKEEDALSTKNPGEADRVVEYIRSLRNAGVDPLDIGVIAPYNAQVALIRSLLSEVDKDVEVSTVDGFQGREKEVIILSMVRSNDSSGNVGFVSDSRRINVAITRPKRHLCIIGNSDTLGGKNDDKNSILPKWVEWCMDSCDIEYAE